MLDPARYSRQLALPGFDAAMLEALGGARVLVIGAGGLGSVVLPQLVGAGVGAGPGGRIGIVDDDVVELSNLHRQHLHGVGDLGRLKVDSAADRLAALDPGVTIVRHPMRFTRDTALGLLADYDLLIDGSDGFATRYLANDAAALTGVPLVWGAVLQFGGQTGVCAPATGPGYRDLFPVPPAADSVLDCATGGVLPAVCGVIGAIMAAEALKIITGLGQTLTARVTNYDALTGRFRELDYERDPHAAPITALIDYDEFCGTGSVAADAVSALDAPSAPDALSAASLAALLTTVPDVQLIDVREPWEHAIGALPGAELIPLGQLGDAIAGLPRDRVTVVYCHHGIRSLDALHQLRAAGIDARHLAGGIEAWSLLVDAGVARY